MVCRRAIYPDRCVEIDKGHILSYSCLIGLFEQNNATPQKVKDFEAVREKGLSVKQWPPCSYNANFIETIWSLLKKSLCSCVKVFGRVKFEKNFTEAGLYSSGIRQCLQKCLLW